jgi:threonine/homoserine/homoserine lactone efflux protein
MTLLPNPDVLAAFTLAAFVLIVTPGPDMALFLGQTLTAGRARGLAAMVGVATGTVVHGLIAAFGLSALLAASAEAFAAVKIAGVAYLIWLATGTLRHGSALTLRRDVAARRPLGQVYLLGLGCNLLNPKIIVFFVTFLPQFVSASDPQAGAKLLFLGLYFVVLALPICVVLILMAERFTAAIRRSPRLMRAIDWLFAGLMGMFAVRLLFWRAD